MTPAGEAFTITGSAAIEPAAEDGGQKIAVTFTFHSSSGHIVSTATSAPLTVDLSNSRSPDVEGWVADIGDMLTSHLPELLTETASLFMHLGLGSLTPQVAVTPSNNANIKRALQRAQKSLRKIAGHNTMTGRKRRTGITLPRVRRILQQCPWPAKETKDSLAVRLGVVSLFLKFHTPRRKSSLLSEMRERKEQVIGVP